MNKDSSHSKNDNIDNLLKIATFAKLITEVIYNICRIVKYWL